MAENDELSSSSLENPSFGERLQTKVDRCREIFRDGFLRFMGLEFLRPTAVQDDSWRRQIINTTNIRGANVTAEVLAETWNKVLSGVDVNDFPLDHVWRDTLDWSKVRRNKVLLAGIRAICIAILTWGFCASVLESVVVSGIRLWTAFRQQSFDMMWSSFFRVAPEHRQVVLSAYGILKVRFGPLFFALKVRWMPMVS